MKMFYKDPIHAAMMAESFGVGYERMECPHDTPDEMINIVPCILLSSADSKEVKIYIHKDSYSIFLPKEGDLYVGGSWLPSGVFGSKVTEIDYATYAFKTDFDGEIIHRNGKAFISPEREE